MSSTGWEVMRSGTGNILQAGARSRSMRKPLDVGSTNGWMTRAVVLQVYFPDEDDRAQTDQKCVLCDVRTIGRVSRTLPKVPVMQPQHGLHDYDLWVPRAATVNTTGEALVSEAGESFPTSAENTDGEIVTVGFLDNDPGQPVIFPFEMPHARSKFIPEKADGRVRRIRHNGTVLSWDSGGNIRIDATEAAKHELNSDGSEQSNSGTGGQITLVTSDGSNQTSIHLNEQAQILLGSDPSSPSTEPLVLGNLWVSVMNDLIDALITLTVGTGVGPSTPPINAPAFEAVRASINANTQLSDFIFAKKSY